MLPELQDFSNLSGYKELFSHTFAAVILRNKYIHKCVSAVLLVVLLFIHSIKLLHTHSTNNSFSHHICNGSCFEKNDNAELAKTSADCGLCSYQLAKDADHPACPELFSPVEQIVLNIRSVLLNRFSTPSVLESRGPPVMNFC